MKKKFWGAAIGLLGVTILGVVVYLHLNKTAPVRVEEQKPPALLKTKARIAIVIDDLGYNNLHLEQIFKTNTALTLSILPHQAFSSWIATQASQKGYECILHMPMEPLDKNAALEPQTIFTDMSNDEILHCLDEAIKSVPEVVGISNHMGSKATADERVMTIILKKVKSEGMYFMDNRTTADSVCLSLARQMKVDFIQRDLFLDTEPDPEHIRTQLMRLKELALKKGKAIGIVHDRDLSLKVISQMIPEIEKEGIEFVPLSALIK